MIKIQDDESTQSYILRVLLINGESSFAGLINNSGDWLRYPYVEQAFLYHFKNCDADSLIEVLLNSKIISDIDTIFSNYFSVYDTLSDVFFRGFSYSTNTRKEKKVAIKYCPHCIKIDLQQIGYGYFRYNWLFSNYCILHDNPLHFINSKSRHSAVISINTVLKGNDVKNSKPCEFDIDLELTPIFKTYQPIKIAPCFQKDLLQWTRKHCHELDRKIDIERKITNVLKSRTGRYIPVSQSKLGDIYSIVQDTNADEIAAFFDVNSTVTIASIPVNDDYHYFRYRASKNHNCSKCILYTEGFTCPKNQSISVNPYAEHLPHNYVNPCDFYLDTRRHYWTVYPIKPYSKFRKIV